MNNVEKKLIQDFENWGAQQNRNETTKEAEEFMWIRFQIHTTIG